MTSAKAYVDAIKRRERETLDAYYDARERGHKGPHDLELLICGACDGALEYLGLLGNARYFHCRHCGCTTIERKGTK